MGMPGKETKVSLLVFLSTFLARTSEREKKRRSLGVWDCLGLSDSMNQEDKAVFNRS